MNKIYPYLLPEKNVPAFSVRMYFLFNCIFVLFEHFKKNIITKESPLPFQVLGVESHDVSGK